MTANELKLWEEELARAEEELALAIQFDDYGRKEWAQEQIRWAKMKIDNLTDYEKYKKAKAV